MKVFAALALAATMAGPAAAQETKAGDLLIRNPVVRSAPAAGANTAGYLTIVNGGAKPDRLLSASCACARTVEVHQSHVMNGTAMMMPVAALDIPAGGQVAFAPGGYHLMITGLKTALAEGAVQPLTLRFQRAGAVVVSFQVKTRIPLQPARPG